MSNIKLGGQGSRGKGQGKDSVIARSEATKQYKITIVITGGFHAENLTEQFKKNNTSYISIIPNFKNCEGYECPYIGILSGTKQIKIDPEIKMLVKGAVLATTGPLMGYQKW